MVKVCVVDFLILVDVLVMRIDWVEVLLGVVMIFLLRVFVVLYWSWRWILDRIGILIFL